MTQFFSPNLEGSEHVFSLSIVKAGLRQQEVQPGSELRTKRLNRSREFVFLQNRPLLPVHGFIQAKTQHQRRVLSSLLKGCFENVSFLQRLGRGLRTPSLAKIKIGITR